MSKVFNARVATAAASPEPFPEDARRDVKKSKKKKKKSYAGEKIEV